MTTNRLTLRPLTNEIDLVDRWLRKAYIKKWFGKAEDWLTEIRNETGEYDYIHHFIVVLENEPIGFCQYYACEKTAQGYPWEHEPAGTFGIDYLIGEEAYLNKGLGNELIKSLVDHILSHEQATRIIADPVPENQVSIALLEKNGFKLDEGTGLYFMDLISMDGDGNEKTCVIRQWQNTDAFNLAHALNNQKIQNSLRDGLPYPYTVEDAKAFIRSMTKAELAFAIIVDGKAVGSIGAVRQPNIHHRTAEMGYFLAEDYWGKGIMTEAVKQMADYIFEKTTIVRIYAEPFAKNTASCRVLEKAGFTCEGILRKNAEKNNELLDMKMYARIKDYH